MSDHIINARNVNARNVGRIAERIVANELEAHGFRVSDLNKEGLAANADLLAVKDGKPWQVQVKGATNPEHEKWWVGYGFCSQEHIENSSLPVFNRHEHGFYVADVVVLVAVCTPKDYRCVVLPIGDAEKAAQFNLNRCYRTPKIRGTGPRKPGRMWCDLGTPKANPHSEADILKSQELQLLLEHEDGWILPLTTSAVSASAAGLS